MEKAVSKPFLRGHLHQAAFFFALGACSVLVSIAASNRARFAILIYAISLAGLYGISAIYHRPNWRPKVRQWLRKIDHAAIFLLIAGTSTPICLIGMESNGGLKLLALIWAAACAGIIKEFTWANSPKFLSSAIYVSIGWLAAPYIPEMAASLGRQRLWLVVAGGIIYSIGALVYALKRPNPFPKVFGYHELFHALVVVASVFHFVVIYQLVH